MGELEHISASRDEFRLRVSDRMRHSRAAAVLLVSRASLFLAVSHDNGVAEK